MSPTWLKSGCAVLVAGVLFLNSATSNQHVSAASLQFTDSVRANLTKTVQTMGNAEQTKIVKQYNDLESLHKEISQWDSKISTLRYNNESTLTSLRKGITAIDSENLRKLEDQVAQSKKKYAPLLNSHSSLTKQVTAAKSFDKTLYKVLKAEADTLKIAVGLARQDIKSKETALKTAKTNRTRKVNQARNTLNGIQTYQTKIKNERSTQTLTNKLITTEWSNFKNATKKGNVGSTGDALNRLVTHSRQIVTSKQNIYNLEVKINAVLQQVSNQLK